MTAPAQPSADGYESFYREFDSPLMRQLRLEAYGEDIGQHSWVSAAELRGDILRLGLSPTSRFLDLGCGPCGPLAFIVQSTGCQGTNGYTQFVAPGWNEKLLADQKFRLIESEDRTSSVLKNATGRLAAMNAHRTELEELSGVSAIARQQDYLETLVDLSQRHVVSRFMYLAEAHAATV